jgi:SAM-dependent methyltransferase
MENTIAYEQKYQNGYGLMSPDGHIVRIYNRIIKYEFGLTKGKVLDFGMGNGTHLSWLRAQGDWDVYGCDISSSAIAQAKKAMPDAASHFHVTPEVPDLSTIFPGKFDLVITNQVLYYLDEKDLEFVVRQLFEQLRPGGIFYASMMPPSSRYFRFSSEIPGSSLRKVELKGRLNETTYINFKTREEMVELFKAFKKAHVGYYETLIREDEGVARHNFFVGTKP